MKRPLDLFQQGFRGTTYGLIRNFSACGFCTSNFSPLLTRIKFIALCFAFVLILTSCCAPAATSSTLPETAFIATFLGLTDEGQTLLVKPEQSKENVQLIYDRAENLVIGQRVYVVGRLEGNLVYGTDVRPL